MATIRYVTIPQGFEFDLAQYKRLVKDRSGGRPVNCSFTITVDNNGSKKVKIESNWQTVASEQTSKLREFFHQETAPKKNRLNTQKPLPERTYRDPNKGEIIHKACRDGMKCNKFKCPFWHDEEYDKNKRQRMAAKKEVRDEDRIDFMCRKSMQWYNSGHRIATFEV
jgi:hypothetical protein